VRGYDQGWRVQITGIGRKRNARARADYRHRPAPAISGMLQSTLDRGIRLAHIQRLIDRQKPRGKARACAIANAKRLGRRSSRARPSRIRPALLAALDGPRLAPPA
jgi:hypothetical protein